MAYTVIPDSEFAEGQPVKGVTGLALRDNVSGLAEGAAGAPKILNDALQPPAAGATYTICVIAGSGEVSTTDVGYPSVSILKCLNSSSHVSLTCLVAGTITCSLQHRAQGLEPAAVRILKGESVVQEWTTSSTSSISRSVDITVNVGDSITFQQRRVTDNGSGGSFWKNVFVTSLNPNFAVA